MNYILQNNLFREESFLELVSCIQKYELNYEEIKVAPFSHEIKPIPKLKNPIICFGSTSLIHIAKKMNWIPGCFYNENFSYYNYIENYGSEMLNFGCEISPIKNIKFEDSVFIRPNDDLKQFSGTIMGFDEFFEWKTKLNDLYSDRYCSVTPDTMAVISKIKKIKKEYRFFVVGKKVVTGSIYKLLKKKNSLL